MLPKGKAKSVIQIWAAGGPPHLDTFDPKPDAGNDYCGPLNKPILTNVGRHPHQRAVSHALAKQADKYLIIRSMTHGNNGHETAAYPDANRPLAPAIGWSIRAPAPTGPVPGHVDAVRRPRPGSGFWRRVSTDA